MPHRLILIGPPGAGKGTQGHMLAEALGAPHIATGDLIREEVAAGTEKGRRFAERIDGGNFISDEDVVVILAHRLGRGDAQNGYVLDGFPRSLEQAKLFADTSAGQSLDRVIALTIEEEALIERLSGRLTCLTCGATYHIEHCPPRNLGACDICGSSLTKRLDDEPDAIRHRMQIYAAKTEPLIGFYRDRNRLVEVDAAGTPGEVFGRVLDALRQAA